MGSKKLYAGVLLFSCALMFTGCGSSKEDDKSSVLVSEGATRTYEMTQVQRGDIQKTKVIVANYQQVKTENLSFSVDRRALAGVYVEKGDSVKEGDLLAELECEEEKKSLAELEYSIQTQKVKVAQIQEQLDLKLSQLARKKGTMPAEEYENRVQELKDEYRLQTEDIEDRIYIQQLQYDELYQWIQGAYIYAGMDGTVTFVADLGSDYLSWAGNKVFTISAEGACAFLCTEADYFSYFNKGETYVLTTSSGVRYETVLTGIDTEKGQMYFEPTIPQYEMPMGQRVLYSLVLEERTNTLFVPKRAVQFVGNEAYVYYYDEVGDRKGKKIEVGLQADSKVEVLNGLAEGDEVILR